MKVRKTLLRHIIMISGIVLLAACSSHIKLNFDADQTINPNINQQSLPVLVKIYQLRDDKAVKQAGFDGLWKLPRQVLGASLVAEKDITMLPNSTKEIKVKYNSDANYIAFVAVFRTRQNDSWKVIKEISSFSLFGRDYTIKLHGNSMDVE